MKIKFEVRGVGIVTGNVRKFGEEISTTIVNRAFRDAVGVGVKAIRAATYTTVQRRTGLLRSGMKHRRVKKPIPNIPSYGVYTLPSGGHGARGRRVPFYWRFIEFGTRKMKPRPYIGRAFLSVASEMVRTFRLSMAAGIEKSKTAKSVARQPRPRR